MCRRTVSASEKSKMLDKLGRTYVDEGCKPGEIANRIARETGMSYRWVMKYLPDGLKARPGIRGPVPNPKNGFEGYVLKDIEEGRVCPTYAVIDIGKLILARHEKPLIVRTYGNVSFVNLTLERKIYDEFVRLGELLGISAETVIGNTLLLTLREIKKTIKLAAPIIAQS